MPFFILGSPRSGTTIIRDILREHPQLEAPEETSFYRWADPFGTNEYTQRYKNDAVIRKHRQMDGISDEQFWQIYHGARNRAQLQIRYMTLYLKNRGNPEGVWFDKTPQNAYGLMRLTQDFPSAPIFHIHRNPVDVVASIVMGRSVGAQSLVGAVNIWRESVQAAFVVKQVFPRRIHFVGLESFIRQPVEITREMFEIIGVPVPDPWSPQARLAGDVSRHHEVFTRVEFDFIVKECGRLMEKLGYSTDPADYPRLLPAGPSHALQVWAIRKPSAEHPEAAPS